MWFSGAVFHCKTSRLLSQAKSSAQAFIEKLFAWVRLLTLPRHGYLAKAILLLIGITSLGRIGITCIDHKTLPWKLPAFTIGIFSSYCVAQQQTEKCFQYLIVLNCWDKIFQLPVCMRGWQPPICSWPGFSSLTYNTNSKRDLSNSVFLGAEGIEHLAGQMEKQHNIHRILNRLYIPAHGECRQLLTCRNQAQHTHENTSNSGYLGPHFQKHLLKKKCMGETSIQSKSTTKVLKSSHC